jgi:O-glycosyl hydrolase
VKYYSGLMRKQHQYLLAFAFMILSCSGTGQEADQRDTKNKIVVHLNDKRQSIRNFGASDAWACQFVGLWPDEKRNQVADWLFSLEEDASGKPKGIGLSLWRFNIGAGSAAQDNISDEWRRTEGFLKDDFTYDWSKQAGQRWFMQAARQRGVNDFLGFTNSPPVQFTKNGKAYSSNGEEANISSSNYVAFSKFLVDVAKQLKNEGIALKYLSPFNEPQWDWTGNGQEGSPYKNTEIFSITKILDSLLTKQEIDVKIQIAEAGKLNYLYEKADKFSRGEQISQFFTSQSPIYMGNFPHVDKIISGHSYFTSAPVETLVSVREKVSQALGIAPSPLEFWQSEYCILGDQEEVAGQGKDLGIDPALYIARVIHHDLTVANASAWHWWLAVSAYDYKDGLIYAEKNKNDGKLEDSKMLWALGNYSRFIRPGATRVNVSSEGLNINNPKGIMVSSFVDQVSNKLVTVIINYGYTDSSFLIEVNGGEVKSWKRYITGSADDEKLKPIPDALVNDEIVIPKRSIVTLVSDLQ